MTLRTILETNKDNLALVIGNGINRYGSANGNCWDSMVIQLAEKYLKATGLTQVPQGISLTEFYDLVQISAQGEGVNRSALHRQFCAPMRTWKAFEHHKAIVSWAQRFNVPILTTNFDNVLHEALSPIKCKRRRMPTGRRSYSYPWDCYYSTKRISSPTQEFAIWHINGFLDYARSIRLGLTEYMGSVRQARSWLRSSRADSLLKTKDIEDWRGVNTWLQILFTKSLLIFGLGLDENEVFLRWLLLERKRYYQKEGTNCPQSWFVHEARMSEGKKFFLSHVDVSPKSVKSHYSIYGQNTWS